jgi:hypothetical protein
MATAAPPAAQLVPAASLPTYPSYEQLLQSTLTGGAFGGVLGLGFHLVGGSVVRAQGRDSLTSAHIVRQGSLAALRLSGLLAGYSLAKGLLRRALGSDALACMGAGGAAVCSVTALDPSRQALLQRSLTAALGKGGPPVPTSLLLVSSFASGAFVVGGLDLALLHGLRWRW